MKKKTIKLLFVCHGNICRSTMAEFVMKWKVRTLGLEERFEIESAATSSEELGSPVYPGTRRALDRHGIDVDYSKKRARRITLDDYDRFDYLVGMDAANLANMRRFFAKKLDGRASKLHLLLDFTDSPGEITDPWYHNDLDATFNEVDAGCDALLKLCRADLEDN